MRNRGRRGQVKMFESIAVLIIFFFLLSFGFTFYGKMQGISNMKKITKAQEIDTVNLAIKASNLPELQCSMKNVPEPNCYDELKLEAFQKITEDVKGNVFMTDHYYQLFDYSTIELNVIYPSPDSILLYNRTREVEGGGGRKVTFLPISLHNPIDKTYKFAYLRVTYYPAG